MSDRDAVHGGVGGRCRRSRRRGAREARGRTRRARGATWRVGRDARTLAAGAACGPSSAGGATGAPAEHKGGGGPATRGQCPHSARLVMLGAVVRCGRASHAAAISAAAPLRAFSGLVINCEDADEWKGSENLFIDRFQRPGESWSWCSPPRGELPDRDLRPDAVVVTGSHYSATLDAPWVHATSSWLRTVVEDPACRTRVFAVCFGHQLLSQALGGRVGRLAAGGFRFDEERIEPRPLFAAGCGFDKI